MLEPFAKHFRHMITFGAASENQLVRGSVVRLCSRASGVGGGMGRFLAEPLLGEMAKLVKNQQPVSDGLPVIEILAAIACWPAMKAALLDLNAVGVLSPLLRQATMRVEEEPDAHIVCSLILDVLWSLCDPDICLNPLMPKAQRLKSDSPSVSDTSTVVAALLASVQHLGEDAVMAQNLIKQLSLSPSGKQAIQKGILRWHASHLALSSSTSTSGDGLEAATRWAAAQLWEAGERLLERGNPSVVGTVCQEICALLEKVSGTDAEEVEELGDKDAAPARFKAAVQAAVQLAMSTGDRSDVITRSASSEILEVRPLAFVYDTTMQLYWKCPSHRKSRTGTAKKLGKWNSQAPHTAPAARLFGEGLSTRKRPREVHKGVYSSSSKQEPVPVTQSVLFEEDLHRHKKMLEDRKNSGLAVPPVLAPPRRGQDTRRVRTAGGSSRPPSLHVDAFEKRAVERTGPGNAAATVKPSSSGSGPDAQKPAEARRSIPLAPPRPPSGPPPPGTPAAAVEQAKTVKSVSKPPLSIPKPKDQSGTGSKLDTRQTDVAGKVGTSVVASGPVLTTSIEIKAASIKEETHPESRGLSMEDFSGVGKAKPQAGQSPIPPNRPPPGLDKEPPVGNVVKSVEGLLRDHGKDLDGATGEQHQFPDNKPSGGSPYVPGIHLGGEEESVQGDASEPVPGTEGPKDTTISPGLRGSVAQEDDALQATSPAVSYTDVAHLRANVEQHVMDVPWQASTLQHAQYGSDSRGQTLPPIPPVALQFPNAPILTTNPPASTQHLDVQAGIGNGEEAIQMAAPAFKGSGQHIPGPQAEPPGAPVKSEWHRQTVVDTSSARMSAACLGAVVPGLGHGDEAHMPNEDGCLHGHDVGEMPPAVMSPRPPTPASPEAPQPSPEASGAESAEEAQDVAGASEIEWPQQKVHPAVGQQEGMRMAVQRDSMEGSTAAASSGVPSAESIASLLRDPARLKQLLKHHPQLTAVLQGHLGGPRPDPPASGGFQ